MINGQVLDSFIGSNIVITGGNGLVGRQVVDLLADRCSRLKVISLDNNPINDKVDYVIGDLCDFRFCQNVFTGADYVFHLAGIKGSVEVTKTKPASFLVPMLMMNTNVLEAARLGGVKKLVYTSSIAAYAPNDVFVEGNIFDGYPMDEYPGMAKRMAEMQIEAYAVQYGMNTFAAVRLANIYGEGDNFDPNNAMVVPSLMYRIFKGENPLKVWGDGSAVRDFLYSRDAAEGIILALYYGTQSRFMNIGSGRGYSVKELVETLREFIDFEFEFDSTKPAGFPKRVMDIRRAKSQINYSPSTSLREGCEATWKWFCSHSQEYLKRYNYFTS